MDIKKIAYLERGKVKYKILKELNAPKTPTILAKKLNIHRSGISRILLELKNKELVKCLNPEDKRTRFYQITEIGKKLIEEYETLNN